MTRRSDSADERTNVTRVTRVDRIHANPSGSRAIADGRERSRRWPTELKISPDDSLGCRVPRCATGKRVPTTFARLPRGRARRSRFRNPPNGPESASRCPVARRRPLAPRVCLFRPDGPKGEKRESSSHESHMKFLHVRVLPTCFRADRICHYKVHLSRYRLSVSLFNGCHFAGVPRENLSIMMAHLGTNSQCRSLF